jgi:predicted nucleic acid-binding protein
MASKLYVETTVLGYLTARPTRDLVAAARQQVTREWWAGPRHRFELYVSELVLAEAAAGDPEAASRRIEAVAGLPLLEVTATVTGLAAELTRRVRLPARAAADAVHVALAAAHGVEYLMTWNLRHIANAELRPPIEAACRVAGFAPPVIATPDELMGGL